MKGSFRSALLVASLLALAAGCRERDPLFVTHLRIHSQPQLDLAPARTATRTWVALDEAMVLLNVHADGRITVRGNARRPEYVRELVRRKSHFARDLEHPLEPSRTYVVLRCDRRAPWRSAATVIAAAVEPDVRVNRVLFAVPPGASTTTERVLEVPLRFPGEARWVREWGPEIEVHPGPAALHRLGPALAALGAERLSRMTRLRVADGALVGSVVGVLDELAAAGAGGVYFADLEDDREDREGVWLDGEALAQ